jgi:hypothetical protein
MGLSLETVDVSKELTTDLRWGTNTPLDTIALHW